MTLVNAQNVAEIRAAYGAKRAILAARPAVYVLEPTSKCSLNCIMCPQSRLGSENLGEISIDRVRKVAEAISDSAELVMLYFMGEPLEHSNFSAVLTAVRKEVRGKIVVSTNCMSLSGENLKALASGAADLVICCIDRWDRRAYERIRRGGKFSRVVAGVERLLAARKGAEAPIVLVKSLEIGMGVDEQEEFADHWQARGAQTIVGWVDTWAGQFPGLSKLSSTPQPYLPESRGACADLWFKMVINWRGEAVLCCHNWDYTIPLGTIGNVGDIDAVWNGADLVRYRTNHAQGRFDCTSICASCREWGELPELDAYLAIDSSDALSLIF